MGVHAAYWSQSGEAWWVALAPYMALVGFCLFLGASWWVLKGDAFVSPDMHQAFNGTEAEILEEPEDLELINKPWQKIRSVLLNDL